MKSAKVLIAATLFAGLVGVPLAFAEDEHKGHHPEGEAPKATESAPAPKQPEPGKGMGGMGMGMMSPDQIKQMRDMCSGMMGGGNTGMMGPDRMKQMSEMCGKMMGGGDMGMMGAKGDMGPASQAHATANAKMHQGMALTFTGDADIDFAKSMIPHHQGAIDMAKIVLQYGKDPEIKKLAEAVVKAQETEVAFLTEWLKKKSQ